jgi:DNA-binding transcriptional ArsR family regulator
MGATKTDHFTDTQNELAILTKALGHPARIAIIEYLIKVNACVCGDIVNELPLSQPTVSQHLKELKNAGLIKGSIEGITLIVGGKVLADSIYKNIESSSLSDHGNVVPGTYSEVIVSINSHRKGSISAVSKSETPVTPIVGHG